MPNVSLNNVVQADIRKLMGTQAFTSGAIATATTTSQVKTTATITYVVDGLFCTKGATDNFWTLPATMPVIQPGSAAPPLLVSSAFGGAGLGVVTRYFFLGIDAAGTAYAYISLNPSAADADVTDGSTLPDIPLTVTIVGIVKVVTTANTIFTPATTLLGTGNTATYYNVTHIPSTLG